MEYFLSLFRIVPSTDRWRGSFCQTHSFFFLILCCFYPSPTHLFAYKLSEYCVSISYNDVYGWHRNAKFLTIFVQGIFGVAVTLFIMSSFSWIASDWSVMPVWYSSLADHNALIGHRPWRTNTIHNTVQSKHRIFINFAHRILKIAEIKVKHLHIITCFMKPTLLHSVDFPHMSCLVKCACGNSLRDWQGSKTLYCHNMFETSWTSGSLWKLLKILMWQSSWKGWKFVTL